MSSLLTFLNITDDKTYKAWCLKNHPDKRTDADAVRQFQEVSRDYNKYIRKQSPTKAHSAPAGKTPVSVFPRCGAHVFGLGTCARRPGLSGRCFYHEDAAHMRFVEGDPVQFFSYTFFDEVLGKCSRRTRDMCTARTKTGRFCTLKKKKGLEVCTRHSK